MNRQRQLLLAAAACCYFAAAGALPGATNLTRVVSGAGSLVFATADGVSDRIFLLDQAGAIRVWDQRTETLGADPFLTLPETDYDGEKGLLGLAFHPDYAQNGLFYLYVSVSGGTQNHLSQVRQYRALGDPATATQADPNSQRLVLEFPEPFANHNGGWLAFSPLAQGEARNYLYIATGDGGSAGDPRNNAQDITGNWLGKMLRIDVSADQFPDDQRRNYAIPATNPFVNRTGDDELWAYGLRNPWRNSFDRQTGDLWIADVGQSQWEEIDFQPAASLGGENYGWKVVEGPACYSNQPASNPLCTDASLVAPVYAYRHGQGLTQGNSVTGGYVYHGSVPEFQGLYFFADYVRRNIWSLDPQAENIAASVVNRNAQLPPSPAGAIGGISSFGEDRAGELYLADIAGRLFRFASDSRVATWQGDAVPAGGSTSWSNPENWIRDGADNTAVVPRDAVILAASAATRTIDLQEPRLIGSLAVQGNYLLRDGSLQILSGQLAIDSGTLTMEGDLQAETAASSIHKLGSGILRINGAAQQIALLEGSLAGTGSIGFVRAAAGTTVGTLLPTESFGELTIARLQLLDGAALQIVLGRKAQGDVVTLNPLAASVADLSGILELMPTADYVEPSVGQIHRFLLVAGSEVVNNLQQYQYGGSRIALGHQTAGLFRFAEVDESGLAWINYNAIPGDTDGDRQVNFADFTRLAGGFTLPGAWTAGDFTGDGVVQFDDFVLLANNFGASLADRSPTETVPEPSAASLLLVLALGGVSGWRRLAR